MQILTKSTLKSSNILLYFEVFFLTSFYIKPQKLSLTRSDIRSKENIIETEM